MPHPAAAALRGAATLPSSFRRRRGRAPPPPTTATRARGGPGGASRDADADDAMIPRRPRLPAINQPGSAARLEVMRSKPLFTIGLFADAQYADRDDHERECEPGRVKYFREGPARLRAAMRDIRKRGGESLACVLNLGDIIDGRNDDDVRAEVPTRRAAVPEHLLRQNLEDLALMAGIVEETRGATPVYHCLGNHDLNVPREDALRVLGGNPGRAAYFTKKLPRGWRLIVLDTTDVNPRYATPGSEAQLAGEAYVRDAKAAAAGGDAARVLGAPAPDDVCKPWGGGVGDAQLAWLEKTLADAVTNEERVLIASHCALSPTSARPGMAAWNARELARTLEACPAVALCVAGHDHPGGYGRTLVINPKDGLHTFGRVHHVTLEAMLEAKRGSTSYATLEVYDHDVAVVGVGAATSRRLQVSPDGNFTGVALFGAAMNDIATGGRGSGDGGGDDVYAGVNMDELSIVDWINANRGRGGLDVKIE